MTHPLLAIVASLFTGTLLAVSGEPPAASPTRVDLLGDALPHGALARLGTIRGRSGIGWDVQSKLLPDGKTLLIAKSEEIHRADLESGRVLNVQPLPKNRTAEGFSDDGRLALLVTKKDYTIQSMRIWDLAGAKEIETLRSTENLGTAVYVLFSNDAKIVLTTHGVNGSLGVLRAWDLQTGRLLWRLGKEEDMGFWDRGFLPLGFSSDRDCVVVQERTGNRVSVRDRMTGKEKRSFPTMPVAESRNVRLSPDGKFVFMGTSRPAVRVWQIDSGKELPELGGHKGQAHSCAVSRDGKLVATGGGDSFVQIWNWPTGRLRRRIDFDTRRSCSHIDFSADGRCLRLIVWGESVARSFDVDTGKEIPPPLQSHRGVVNGVAFAEDGKLISAGQDDTVRIWDWQTGKHVAKIRTDHPVGPMSFALAPDWKTIATADINRGEVALIDRDLGNHIRRLDSGLESACQIAFSPVGRKLAVVGPKAGNRNVVLLDSVTGRELRRFDGHRAIAFSPDGRWLAADSTHKIDVWEADTGRKRLTIQQPFEAYFRTTAFSPDGRVIVRGGSRSLAVLELITGGMRFRAQSTKGYCDTLAVSPDGRWLATDDGGDVRIWDMRTGQPRHVFAGHNGVVTSLAFSRDGRRLASGSVDTNILIWDMSEVKAPAAKAATMAEVAAAWERLKITDAAASWAAIQLLADNPNSSLPLLRSRLKPDAPVEEKAMAVLLSKLSSAVFADREQAEREIRGFGDRAQRSLAAFLGNNPPAEARKRAQKLLIELNEPIANGELLRGLRSIEVLEWIATDEAKEMLRKLATGEAGSRLTVEAKAALRRLGDVSVAGQPEQTDNKRR